MTNEKDAATPQSLTASAAPHRRHPDRRLDPRGVVIGPWSDSVKRATVLMRAVERH